MRHLGGDASNLPLVSAELPALATAVGSSARSRGSMVACTTNQGEPMSTTDEARVTEAVEQLLVETDPKQVDKVTFRGAVYDAGLAWIHFPEGWGGMGLAPTHQRIVEKALREAGGPSMGQTQFFGLALAGPTAAVLDRRAQAPSPRRSGSGTSSRTGPAPVRRPGERVLGLPGEPRVDKDLPWKDVPR